MEAVVFVVMMTTCRLVVVVSAVCVGVIMEGVMKQGVGLLVLFH